MTNDPNEQMVCPMCSYEAPQAGMTKCPECGYSGPAEKSSERQHRVLFLAPLFVVSCLVCSLTVLVASSIVRLIEYDQPAVVSLWLLRMALGSIIAGLVGGVALAVCSRRLSGQPTDSHKRLVWVCLAPALIGIAVCVVTLTIGIGILVWASFSA